MSRALRIGINLLAAAIAIQTSAAVASADSGPPWLRAPAVRGPIAASFTFDDRDARWGVDAVLPLRSMLGRGSMPGGVGQVQNGRPTLGLGLAIGGHGTAETGGMRYTALLDRRSDLTGTWLGVSSGEREDRSQLRVAAGLWRSLSHLEVESDVISNVIEARQREDLHWGYPSDSLHWRDTTTFRDVDRSVVQLTTQSALRWRHGPIEVATLGGVIVGNGFFPKRWAQATLEARATSRLNFLAAFGNRPTASLAFDPSARPRTMLGAQLALGPGREAVRGVAPPPAMSAWHVRSLGKDRRRLSLRSRIASLVEIEGDFTGWTPVTLNATGSGWWEGTLVIPPGLHQVRIRLDGREWQVPPGLPRAEGEFAGPAGMLIID
jgi:hypothetical protein